MNIVRRQCPTVCTCVGLCCTCVCVCVHCVELLVGKGKSDWMDGMDGMDGWTDVVPGMLRQEELLEGIGMMWNGEMKAAEAFFLPTRDTDPRSAYHYAEVRFHRGVYVYVCMCVGGVCGRGVGE